MRKGFDRLTTRVESGNNGRGEGEEMVQADERQGMWEERRWSLSASE